MKTNPLHICFFGTYDRTYTSNILTLQGLAANGAKVSEVNAHIKVTTLNKQSEMGWFQLIKRVFKKYRIFVEIAKNWSLFPKVDVIYVGYPGHFDVLFAVVLGKIFRKPVVFNPLLIFYIGFVEEQRILKPGTLLARILKWGESLVYKSVDLVIADTPFQEELLIKDFGVKPKNICTVPIGADDRAYGYTPFTNDKGHKLHVVYYGLYSPIHGIEHLLDAAEILKNNADISFTFVGNGQTFKPTFERAQKLKLKNIKFVYDVPESEHFAILQTADVFLGFLAKHPTVERVIPNKVYQGLSLGKVVLTADSVVAKSIFTHRENMYLVPPANGQAVADALLELSEYPKQRLKIAQNGHKLFVEHFSPKSVGRLLLKNMARLT